MDAIIFTTLALACAPDVHPGTAQALVAVESGFDANAIGVVGGVLERQPRTRAEALATAVRLQAGGWNFSVGLAQINVRNFERLGLTIASAFDPCENLKAMQAVMSGCFEPAQETQLALRRALSCYYSGNVATGYRDGYVQRVVHAAAIASRASSAPPQPAARPSLTATPRY